MFSVEVGASVPFVSHFCGVCGGVFYQYAWPLAARSYRGPVPYYIALGWPCWSLWYTFPYSALA